jgi:hypothetical protein
MNTINNIHNRILQKIESGAIHQKPKWHFVLATLAIVFGFIALSLILLYLVSFVALFLREHLIFEALSFGPGTVFAIMHTLPYLLILLVITVFLLIHLLVRHFAFAYMKPVMVTLGGGLAVTLILFTLVLVGDKDSRIARFGEDRHVPGFDVFHAHFRDAMPPRAIHGVVTKVSEEGLSVQGGNEEEMYVHVTDTTRKDQNFYSVGDSVAIFAERRTDGLYAMGIRKDIGTSTSTTKSGNR